MKKTRQRVMICTLPLFGSAPFTHPPRGGRRRGACMPMRSLGSAACSIFVLVGERRCYAGGSRLCGNADTANLLSILPTRREFATSWRSSVRVTLAGQGGDECNENCTHSACTHAAKKTTKNKLKTNTDQFFFFRKLALCQSHQISCCVSTGKAAGAPN